MPTTSRADRAPRTRASRGCRVLAGLASLALIACDSTSTSPTGDLVAWSAPWLERERQRYLTDTAYRRAVLEASLVNHANLYSRQRLDAYGLGARGWDLLPAWIPRSQGVTAAVATELERGDAPRLPPGQAPLWDGRAPTTDAGWIALGRRVFFEYPLRAEVFAEHGLTRPALARAVGLERTRDGGLPGLVVFADVDGDTRVGITCALCHTAVQGGELVVGAARRSFDYGRLRLAYFADTGAPLDPRLAQRMATWGPGRADVTEDNDEDPVAIPDLWGLREMATLTQAGTIRHTGPLALAIRQETQLVHTNHQRVRPPRELAWALAMFLYTLTPPPAVARPDPELRLRGARVFAEACSKCHANPAYGGGTVAVATIGTDPALARGTARGTGRYRVPPLLGVAEGAPYLHHGAVASLGELLSPARLAEDYTAGRLGPGPIPGHPAGTTLGAEDRAALLAFLLTL